MPVTEPYIVPDDWSIERRLKALDQIVREGTRDPALLQAAARIRREAHRMAERVPSHRGDWFARLLALEALRFVHQVPYLPDPPGKDRFAPVWWTLKNGGDCDDLGALYASLCCALGLRCVVAWITQPGQALDHVTCLVWLDGAWWFAEPSVPGAMLGESPYHAIERQGAWYVLGGDGKPSPDGRFRDWDWDGWELYWNGWPRPWFQRNYPYLFHAVNKVPA